MRERAQAHAHSMMNTLTLKAKGDLAVVLYLS